MAGIGVKLRRIYGKQTLITYLAGFGYSSVVTIAPMLVVILNILLMSRTLGYETVRYADRALFLSSILYFFVFSLLAASPFGGILARYMTDKIYEECYGDVLACYYMGLLLNVLINCALCIPFCFWQRLVGGVDLGFICVEFCGYISMALAFYSMTILSSCKDYQRISAFFAVGMVFAFAFSLLLVKGFHQNIVYSMLAALAGGFFLIASLELATIQWYFKGNSHQYRPIMTYCKKYWPMMLSNFFYMLGLYIHNFVFWATPMRIVVAKSFVYAPEYDLATCLAMFTNLSATTIIISRTEMHFYDCYKMYSEAVIGGRWSDIKSAKDRMFRRLSGELMNLVRIQFIVSVVIYLVCIIVLPRYGFSSSVLKIYPCLAVGYFILFLLYSEIIFLGYFKDEMGALLSALLFCVVTWAGSLISRNLPSIWYGLGLTMGSFVGFTAAYFRLRWVERNMDWHIFCAGSLLRVRREERPSSVVYRRAEKQKKGGTE